MKDKILYITILILFILSILFYHNWDKTKAEKETLIRQQNIEKTIQETEKGQTQIIYRESNLYPKIDKRLKEIETQIKDNNKRISDEIKNTNINDLHKLYIQLGYSSSIIR